MQDEHSDRESLLQQTRDLLRVAKAKFSRVARARERAAENAKVREMRAAHRAAKRLPAKIANKRARQRRYKLHLATVRKASRAADRAKIAALLSSLPIEPVILDEQAIEAERVALAAYAETRGARQGQVRKLDPAEIMACRRVHLFARAEGALPSWQGFAERFGAATGRAWSREQAKRRVALMIALEGSDGPWQASPEGVRGFSEPPEVCGAFSAEEELG